MAVYVIPRNRNNIWWGGGRGGGRPNMAQAGGSDASGIDAALDAARAALGI